GPELYVFRAGRHLAHLDNILDILAGVEMTPSDPIETLAPALSAELRQIAAVVFVLLDWDVPRATLVRSAAEAGCRTKVIVVRQEDTTLPAGDVHQALGDYRHLLPDAILKGEVSHL